MKASPQNVPSPRKQSRATVRFVRYQRRVSPAFEPDSQEHWYVHVSEEAGLGVEWPLVTSCCHRSR